MNELDLKVAKVKIRANYLKLFIFGIAFGITFVQFGRDIEVQPLNYTSLGLDALIAGIALFFLVKALKQLDKLL